MNHLESFSFKPPWVYFIKYARYTPRRISCALSVIGMGCKNVAIKTPRDIIEEEDSLVSPRLILKINTRLS
jgi:hypothetical protein